MATKKELTQAQAYSRRRLTTAFVSGIPGGKELEPSKPMRAVISGVALSIILIVVSLILGFFSPSLPDGWDDNALILAKQSGSRYVSVKSELYPVINITSARLLIPAGEYKVFSVDEDKISDFPRGTTRGILGAPDALPLPKDLSGKSWSACMTPPADGEKTAGISAVLNPNRAFAKATDKATVVTVGDTPYLIAGGYRYEINKGERNGIMRAIGLDSQEPTPVTSRWLSLFPVGTPLTPLDVPHAGSQPPNPVVIEGASLDVGTIIHVEGTPENERHFLTKDGELGKLTPFAYPFYLLGSGAGMKPLNVAASEVAALRQTTKPIAPADWPVDLVEVLPSDAGACALLNSVSGKTATTTLATPIPFAPDTDYPFRSESGTILPGVFVAAGSGALVRAMATADGPVEDGTELNYDLDHGNAFLIDHTGTLFPMPLATEDTLARLGYSRSDLMDIPQPWTALFVVGPELTIEAAMASPVANTGP